MVAKVTKRSLLTGIIILLLMMMYSLCFCLYSFLGKYNWETNDKALWITYVFTMGIFAIAFVTTVMAFERKELRSRVFGIPIVLVGFGAIAFQAVIDLFVMFLGAWVAFNENIWILLLILEAFYTVCVIALVIIRQAYRGLVIEAIDRQQEKQSFIREIQMELKLVCETNTIDELDKPLNKIYEAARYSDPVSEAEVQGIEDEILAKTEDLRDCLEDGDIDSAKICIDKINSLFTERKIRVKANKK